jgi:hypothetical protein
VDPVASGRIVSVSNTLGALAELTFTGTSVTWLGRLGPQGGMARAFVDGAFVAEVDTFFPFEVHQALILRVEDLPAGPSHTLMIEVSGGRNPEATDAEIVIDAFEVSR